MESMLDHSEPGAEGAWEQLAPVLDRAMAQLGEADRSAVVLRFFEDKSLREVAAVLGVGEMAAQKRISRAVEKLRRLFLARGVTVSAGSLAAALAANSVQAAPAGLVSSVTAAAALKGATAGSSTLTLIKGVLTIMAWTKLKTSAVIGVAALAVIGTPIVVVKRAGAPAVSAGFTWQHSEPVGQPREENPPPADALQAADEDKRTEPRDLLPVGGQVSAAPGSAQAATNSLPESEPWRQRFEAAYKLRDGKVLRRVGLPFIPERMEFYRQERPDQAAQTRNGPDYIVFRQDERGLISSVVGIGSALDLQGMLRSVLKLKRYELAGVEEVFALPVGGDWVFRDGARIESKLTALEPILREATGRNVTFEKQTVDDDVVVVRGSFAPEQRQEIDVFAEQTTPLGAGGGSGDFRRFLEELGDRLNIAFASEVHLQNGSRFQWSWHLDSDYSQAAGRPADLVGKTLENLSQQTGLSFELQRRPTQVWLVREKR